MFQSAWHCFEKALFSNEQSCCIQSYNYYDFKTKSFRDVATASGTQHGGGSCTNAGGSCGDDNNVVVKMMVGAESNSDI